MFSQEQRCVYQKNQLIEVICQLRFPEILSIGANAPVDFQEAVRDEYPAFQTLKEVPAPRITGAPGNFSLAQQPERMNYQFVSADGVWKVNLTSRFISLSCAKYTCWEDFAAKLDKPLAAFIRIYHPAYFERLGLRFVNAFSKVDLDLEGTSFRELIAPCYLGVLAEDDVQESRVARNSMEAELAVQGGCRVKIHAGPGMIKRRGQEDKEIKFIFDCDLFMQGQTPVNLSAGAMQTMHMQADDIFRGAITDKLHEAMEPQYLY